MNSRLDIHAIRQRRWKTLVVILLLGTFLFPLVGVPLPSRLQPTKKSSAQFPCQHKACGCRDAQSCWKNCCCHTNSQKVAWARKHAVTPPEYVVTAAKREKAKLLAATCFFHSDSRKAQKTPVSQHDADRSLPAKTKDIKSRLPLVSLANMEAYRKCKGLASYLLLLGHALMCDTSTIAMPDILIAGRVACTSETAESTRSQPPSPPPRHHA